ncbi:hypothetical protein [Microbacterium halophytorum]|uniref:hypothetical protein n=1 Tax=Microbacterium halophytorum TaxID=2067568 RepID=UPI000CFC9EF9|nr:hypothetical protein [Microbacterium halophytorum]
MSDPDQPTPRPPAATAHAIRGARAERPWRAAADEPTPAEDSRARGGGAADAGERDADRGAADAGAPDGGSAARAESASERVADIESLPLAERAAGYRALHEELAQRLEQAPGDA